MFNISSFLEKFSKKIDDNNSLKEYISNVVEEKTKIKIDVNDIEVKDNIIYLKSSPAVKNKIFIYKSNIMLSINTNINSNLVDIR